ncbi:MAG TPA: DUF4114 domain-containing protein [Candidatus Limnocylindria bacterium]|nr:DUF4114 domain-containing protein [Candidatus Limnocylindria bacterium]
MKAHRYTLGWLVAALAAATLSTPAAAQVPVSFGTSWDGPQTLQTIVDNRYGAGRITITNDYLGANIGEPDPWFWVDQQFSALMIREVAGNANHNVLGWYIEGDLPPVIDGVDDGVVFDGPAGQGAMTVISFDHPNRKFGFYLNPNGPNSVENAPDPELFFTNRLYNDIGPDGSGALHAPTNGDVQALIFDISAWTQPNTWLVCFEDLDSGAVPSACCSGTDNDFNDLVFEVTAFGATPVEMVTFGSLKARYR